MALTWLITRPLEDALPMVEALAAKGVAALAVPCIERVELEWPSWVGNGVEGSRLPAPGSRNSTDPQVPRAVRVVMITSGAVIARLVQHRAELEGVTIAALAPTTASKLRAAGFAVGIEAEGGVRELAVAIMRWAEGRQLEVLYPTSDAAEKQTEHQEALAALSKVSTVRVVPVYSTRPAPRLTAAFAAAPRPFGLFLASPSAVEACVAALAPHLRGEGDDRQLSGAAIPPGVPGAGSREPEAQRSLAPTAAVLHGASTLRAWKQYAPAHWPTPVPYDRTHDLAATLLATGATP